MKRIERSIPVKISLAILIIEFVLLAVMGIFYITRFSQEIDQRITDKLALPGILMNQRAMPYDSVRDLSALSDLVQEKVVEAFIFKREGKVFFTADPAKEERPFTDFLNKEEKIGFGGDRSLARQVAFIGENAGHYISSITPLRANGELLGGLYVKISTDAAEERKKGVVLFFCLGALLTIFLTTLIEAFVVHRLFAPRIINALAVLKEYAGGDFSARIAHIGAPDQLGDLMRQVNSLLETVEDQTRKLHALNATGEALARIREKQDIYRIVCETAEQQLPVLALKDGEDDDRGIFSLPVQSGETKQGGPVVRFVSVSGSQRLSLTDASFVYALSGLMESALDRIEAFCRIAEAEEKYRDLFISALEGIFRTSPDGRPLEVNPALAAMAGFDSVEDFTSSTPNVSARYTDPGKRTELWRILVKEGIVRDFEIMLLRKDGSSFPASISAHLVINDQGEIEAIEGRIIDISERKQREQEKREQLAAEAVARARLLLVEDLEKKNKQLQEALDELKCTQLQLVQSEKMAAVGMTAGGVAHDLNNILAGVVSYPELLLATLPADNEVRGPLEAILASGRRAAAVVADLLTLAKGSARVKQNVVLDSLVEEYLQSVEFRHMMRGYPNVHVTSVYEAGEMCVNCSPIHIQKAIMNLVINAVEALAPAGGSVTLRTWPVRQDLERDGAQGEYVVLEVNDDGPGIPPENREHIFEPFYTRKVMGKKGTGLGLTVVWNVVREHEGRIELDCESPGTTFRIFLPAQKIGATADTEQAEEVDLRGQGRILVVDDERLQRDVAEKMLSTFGYSVQSVPSGEAAIGFLSEQSVDLVILDMLMPPGMNGLQTYREILALRPGQKALVVSGFSESSDVKMAMQLGVGGFVKKPYTMAQIAGAVKDELSRVPVGGTEQN